MLSHEKTTSSLDIYFTEIDWTYWDRVKSHPKLLKRRVEKRGHKINPSRYLIYFETDFAMIRERIPKEFNVESLQLTAEDFPADLSKEFAECADSLSEYRKLAYADIPEELAIEISDMDAVVMVQEGGYLNWRLNE